MKQLSKIYPKLVRSEEVNRTIIDSELFAGVMYEVTKGHIVIHAGAEGKLAINMRVLNDLMFELSEIREMYI